jgi:hypothetical protein
MYPGGGGYVVEFARVGATTWRVVVIARG